MLEDITKKAEEDNSVKRRRVVFYGGERNSFPNKKIKVVAALLYERNLVETEEMQGSLAKKNEIQGSKHCGPVEEPKPADYDF